MPHDAILPTHVDSTMVSCFNTCKQRFFKEFVLGLRPAEVSIDLHAGGAFSGSLETFYKKYHEDHLPSHQALTRTLPTFLNLWGDFTPGKTTAKTRDNMWNAIDAYIKKWPPETDHVQPFDFNGRKTVEFSFAVPLTDAGFPRHPVTGDPFIYCGRIDMLGTYNNRTCVRDEKTTGRLDSNWSEKWDLRGQFLGYCWGVSASGIPCDTAVIRGIVIHTRDILCVEAIKMYAQWEIDRWYEQLRRTMNSMVQCWKDKWFDYNLGEACTMWGGCSYRDLCKSKDETRWYDTFKTRRWNPLDRNPIEPAQGV